MFFFFREEKLVFKGGPIFWPQTLSTIWTDGIFFLPFSDYIKFWNWNPRYVLLERIR